MTLRQIVQSRRFDLAICFVIVLNAVALSAQTYGIAGWPEYVNACCLGIFTGELAVRVLAAGRAALRDRWLGFDAVVILASLMPVVGTVAQIARVARVARLIRFLPEARVILAGAGRALPALGSLFALTALLIFLYGMAAVELFGAGMPEQFGNLGAAALTLFVMLSLENFPDTLYAGIAVTPWAIPFFISYALLAAFVVFNLVIGIVISALEDARDRVGAEKREGADV